MGYHEHAPTPALAPWLACVWERTADRDVAVRVLPDGCIDVVWSQTLGPQLVGLSERTLRRRVTGAVGYGP